MNDYQVILGCLRQWFALDDSDLQEMAGAIAMALYQNGRQLK